MSELTFFKINLDNQNSPIATYNPGQLIVGHVIIDLNKSKKLRAIKLRFTGQCEVRWTENRSSNKHVEYREVEEYFNNDIILFGNPNGETLELPRGHHKYPFTFLLPQNIPNSFEHKIANIRYKIKAILDRPWKFDHETMTMFTVESQAYELQPNNYQTAVNDNEVTNYGCCILPCVSTGKIFITYQIPTLEYACGENIDAIIKLDNKSPSIDVTKVKIRLIQKFHFHVKSRNKTKSVSNIVQKQKISRHFPKNTEVRMGLTIPELPHSTFPHCSLIDVDYKIHISVHVTGCHCASDKKYNIVIGSRPAAIISSSSPSSQIMTSYPVSNFISPNTLPSAPIDLPSAPLLPNQYPDPNTIPYPMPMPMQSKTNDNQSKNNSSLTPFNNTQIPAPYPPYPPLNNFQQTSPVFDNYTSLPPPPSYEDVMASKK